MAVLAHIGHWYAELLYVLPVVLVVLWLSVANRREKRRKAAGDDGLAPGPPPPGEPSGVRGRKTK